MLNHQLLKVLRMRNQFPISMIWAEDSKGGIGLNGKMPWHLPEDLKWFKEFTMNKVVVFGRTTWEGFDSSYLPFSGRDNVILTSDQSYFFPGAKVMNSVAEVLEYAKINEVVICGGNKVYESFLEFADSLYITRIEKEFETDTFAPKFDESIYSKTEIDSRTSQNGLDFKIFRFDKLS